MPIRLSLFIAALFCVDPPDELSEPEEPPVVEASPDNPLLPPKERELVDPHPIDLAGMKYTPTKGLDMTSKDGRFAMQIRLRAQMRYELHNRREETDEGEIARRLTHTFGIRRARIQFTGHVFNEHNKFKSEFAFSPRDLAIEESVPHRSPLLTWYFEFDYLRDLTVRMGQYKIPFNRQRVMSSGDLQLVDRSIANGEFTLDRDVGIDLRSKDIGGLGGRLRYYAGIYMGEGRDAWNEEGNFDLHYLARFEVNPFGKFQDYSEADFERSSRPGLSFAAAYSFIDEANRNRGVLGKRPADGGTSDYHSVVGDVLFKWKGWSVFSEVFWRRGTRRMGDATVPDPDDPTQTVRVPKEAPRNGLGWMVQTGYLIPRLPLEFEARYAGIRASRDPDTSISVRDSLGGGVSYYIAQHPLKIQADYFRHWREHDLRVGEDVVRVQVQLAF